jgi:proline dehydrogenase
MAILRRILLAGAENVWLRERAMRYPFVRRSVSRFMPGESMAEALEACRRQETQQGTGTILTRLGENVASLAEAEAVARHYLELLDRVEAAGLNAQVSVKLTQLGLDLGAEACAANLVALIDRAEARGNMVWIDMESSKYVDSTLDLFRRARSRSARTGVCLQAYLRRTASDLESLLPLAPSIRLVKGAYREPSTAAFPKKAEVDANYFALASRMLEPDVPPGSLLAVGTHDERLVERLRGAIAQRRDRRAEGGAATQVEFEMLYGIQRPLQERLVAAGVPLRVLVSYGEYWFPWYMRRLAERPANVFFLARSLFAG